MALMASAIRNAAMRGVEVVRTGPTYDPRVDLIEGLRTNPAAREFTDEPVSDEVLAELLDVARFAPSGGNRQPWHVAVVQDRALRQQLADLCDPVWQEYMAIGATGATPFAAVGPEPSRAELDRVPNPVIDRLVDVPVVLVVAADLGAIAMMDGNLDRPTITGGASVYPFVLQLLLAARDRGLGGVLTTFLARAEEAARPLLGLPDTWAIAALVAIGHPTTRPTRLRRNPVATFATVDRFDGPAFGG
jgi:nitroreductase